MTTTCSASGRRKSSCWTRSPTSSWPRWRRLARSASTRRQLDRLTKEAFTFKEGHGAGCPEPVLNKALIGKDAAVLARAAGASVPDKTELLFAETAKDHVFVKEEQMMPFIPIVRVKTVEEGIEASLVAEHNYKHTSIIHSHDVEHMTAMARALDTTLFIKNGPCMAGLGPRRRGLPELLHRDAHRRRRHQPAHVHPRPPLRDGG